MIARTFKSTFVVLFCLAFLGGCNTMAGAGKDIEAAGDAIEDAATDNKSY